MPAPSGVKLRDSCNACASSKVKCSKDKPTCARCAERGTSCQYLVTQRTGRKFRNRNNSQAQSSSSSSQATTPPLSRSPSSPHAEPASGHSFFDPFGTTLDATTNEFISTLSTPTNFSLPVVSNQDLLNTFGHAELGLHNSNDSMSLPAASDFGLSSLGLEPELAANWMDMDLSSAPNLMKRSDVELWSNESNSASEPEPSLQYELNTLTQSASSAQLPQLDAANSFGGPQQSDCLRMALELMGQLSCQDGGLEHQASRSRSLHNTINKNKNALGVINSMLPFADSDDGYFLVVISMILSKVLDRYAAAARGSAHVTPDQYTKPELEPQSAQKVLTELYQVQKLIDDVASRIQTCVQNLPADGEATTPDLESAPVAPFSAPVLNQLHAGLRKRISTLSLELIDGLRQYWR